MQHTDTFLARGLKLTHLQLIAAVSRCGGIQSAADHLGISQPAASRLAAEIEQIVGQKIHRRVGKGIELTAAGVALANRALRALREIGDAQNDILEIGQGMVGTVRIGSVTGPAIEYILPVLQKARLAMPNVSISVEVATSDVLGDYLANGDLDFVLGRMPVGHNPIMFEEVLIDIEPVSFIARRNHALTRAGKTSAKQLLNYDWVLPFEGTVLHLAIEQALRRERLPLPGRTYNTSSFLLTLALVQRSNAIAPIATSVAKIFTDGQEQSKWQKIDTDFEVNVEEFSFLKLADRLLTPSAQAVFEMAKDIAQKSKNESAEH